MLNKHYILESEASKCYKASKRIGKGITGYVYLATDLIDKHQVAIKYFKKTENRATL